MDKEKLIKVIPAIIPVISPIEIPLIIDKFKIDNKLSLSHFLAQVAHESGDFKFKSENLNYSKDGLLKIFPKYFTPETALVYQRQPEKIANRVYANRFGNGDEKSGDGYKFRGRGYIQVTFKNNYIEFDKTVDDDILSNPDLVSNKYPLVSAGWYWNSRKLNSVANLGDTIEVVTKVTKVVNGGINGLSERVGLFRKYYEKLKTI